MRKVKVVNYPNQSTVHFPGEERWEPTLCGYGRDWPVTPTELLAPEGGGSRICPECVFARVHGRRV